MPRMQDAQRKLDALADVDPVVVELASASNIREQWEAMDLATKRRVIRALMLPAVKKSGRKRGSKGLEPDRVEPGWR